MMWFVVITARFLFELCIKFPSPCFGLIIIIVCVLQVKKLLTSENVNCRDEKGRNSTPLHLAGNVF